MIKDTHSDRLVSVAYRIGWGLAASLVLLRLVVGWHFYREGTKKLTYDKGTGKIHIANAAEPFLRQAVGPWAPWFKRDLPGVHDWERLLIVPRRSGTTEDEAAVRTAWAADYAKRRQAAEKEHKLPAVEFPPNAPYTEWARQIDADWAEMAARFQQVDGLSEEQRTAAAAAYAQRLEQLAQYLASQETSFADWQHELWRLGDWEAAPEADDLPHHSARIAEKRGETSTASTGWVGQVRDLEAALVDDLRDILTPEQAANPQFVAAVNDAFGDARERKLHRLNVAVTCLLIGVGACLMLGLFTRLAALGGIFFLALVVATQPPWAIGAVPTYNQLVEVAALVVLLVAGAGRWAGLDFFLRALVGRRRAVVERRLS